MSTVGRWPRTPVGAQRNVTTKEQGEGDGDFEIPTDYALSVSLEDVTGSRQAILIHPKRSTEGGPFETLACAIPPSGCAALYRSEARGRTHASVACSINKVHQAHNNFQRQPRVLPIAADWGTLPVAESLLMFSALGYLPDRLQRRYSPRPMLVEVTIYAQAGTLPNDSLLR
jgi:hypothetical protein